MSSFEYAARQKKAALLVGALSAVGIPAHKAKLMTDDEWLAVCKCAGVRMPSESTKQAVYQELEDMAAPKRMTVREWQKQTEDTFLKVVA